MAEKKGINCLMKKNEKGQILVLVLIVFATIMILGTGLLSLATTSHQQSIKSVNKQQAYNVAKSTLDMYIEYLVKEPEMASQLLPVTVGANIKSSIMKFKDGNEQEWESQLEIMRIDSSNVKLTVRTNGTEANSNIEEEISAIMKEVVVNNTVAALHAEENIKVIGSSLDMKNGSLFAKGSIDISAYYGASAIDKGIHLKKIEALNELSIIGAGVEFVVDEIYAGTKFVMKNNPFKLGTSIGKIKTTKSSVDISGNSYAISEINPGGIQYGVPAMVAPPLVEEPDVSEKFAIINNNIKFDSTIANNTTIKEWKPDQNTGQVDVANTYGPMQDNIEYKIRMENETENNIEIMNQLGGAIRLDIYNPKGTVEFIACGLADAPTEFKGSIVAREIKVTNCEGISFDFEGSSIGSTSRQFELVKYVE